MVESDDAIFVGCDGYFFCYRVVLPSFITNISIIPSIS